MLSFFYPLRGVFRGQWGSAPPPNSEILVLIGFWTPKGTELPRKKEKSSPPPDTFLEFSEHKIIFKDA